MSRQNPRQITIQILGQRRVNGEFTEVLVERALSNANLSAPDRGLCQEIVYGCVRRQATLDWLIARKTHGREQKVALQNLLRTGLYQLFWLDRIPAHAAVHETVEIAKQLGFGPQAGFVNAVLRGYLREFDETKKYLARLKTEDPAIGYSHPQWLVEKWRKRFGDGKWQSLLEWNNSPPKNFARVNTLKIDAGKLLEKWRQENIDYDFVRRDWLPENLIFELKSHPPLNSLQSFRDGWFYLQDPSTLLASLELNPRSGETILDLCAAPGGKTTFMAQQMKNEGKIVAGDISEERLKLVRENCQRLGITIVDCRLPVAGISEKHPRPDDLQSSIFNRQFDRVLIDAPCSNTGVMRRRVDLRWRISPGEISRLRQTQFDLLKAAAKELKSGGMLIYSTCSLEPEENSEVVEEFLRGHSHFKLEMQRELLPFADGIDGAFIARLSRQN